MPFCDDCAAAPRARARAGGASGASAAASIDMEGSALDEVSLCRSGRRGEGGRIKWLSFFFHVGCHAIAMPALKLLLLSHPPPPPPLERAAQYLG